MKIFKDKDGCEWTLEINVSAIKRVLGLAQVNLANANEGEPPLHARLSTDLLLCGQVIFALLKPQADQRGVAEEQFCNALDADTIAAAQEALFEELLDFFQRLRRTEVVAAIRKQRVIYRLAATELQRRIEALDEEKVVASAIGSASGNTPASSASTPAP